MKCIINYTDIKKYLKKEKNNKNDKYKIIKTSNRNENRKYKNTIKCR